MERAIIKGFADRARALCDEKHLAEELHNIEDVFVANGYPRETVRRIFYGTKTLTDRQKRAGRTGKLWSHDHTIFERAV